MNDPSKPMFWRDLRMPYVELRKVGDGRKVCYAPHSHTQWSLGAITEGKSTFLYRSDQFEVSAGALVVINPNWVHACNPIDNQPWGYLMLYIDTDWLTKLRYESGLLGTPCWQDISTAIISDHKWYTGYCRMAECLLDSNRELLEKQTVVVEYLTALMHELSGQASEPVSKTPDNFQALADYLRAHAAVDVSLDTLCERSGFSPGHLIRSFKRHFGLTPHAYLINYRIQRGQQELKHGKPIAETALNVGFADQPHFQRTFKKLLAATPKQYRQSLLNQQIDTTGGK
ncbi:AraC-type DNA-binding protein [Marinobacter sp. LV10R510-11A]|uniref:AraC family transcriptional regulator n=1 Tax=Marinobacter sp. LV10R510-11A TaxID=1415568 RepID=UPI000BB93E66|nr:AraC family transcriptional regulator [Marinobacter sp. LV10R510-11A]SOB75506.1 AraC-type DNA-binding protein [Marinobacter sp. LV10R510-11A]